MSVAVPGFKSGELLESIRQNITTVSADMKQDYLKKVNAIFQFDIKNSAGEVKTWVIDFKKEGNIFLGKPSFKPDIVINLGDETFVDLATGKLNGQKAFMQGKLKVKGNLMMAMRLDTVLKTAPADTKNALQGGAAPAAPAAAAPAGGASIQAPGFLSSSVFSQIKAGLDSAPAKEREGIVQKTKAIYQFDLKNGEGKTQSFTLDLKNGKGDAYLGPSKSKADVTMILADKDFVDLSQGKLNGQKAFMSGKLKVRGQIMLATKLDGVLKSMQKKPKL